MLLCLSVHAGTGENEGKTKMITPSEGAGGERPEGSGGYYSYIRDLDGNKICAFTNNK